MATTYELAEAIAQMIALNAEPIPITLMNHDVDTAASVMGAIVQRCADEGLKIRRVWIDPELGVELGLRDGVALPHGSNPVVAYEEGLGRQVRFEK